MSPTLRVTKPGADWGESEAVKSVLGNVLNENGDDWSVPKMYGAAVPASTLVNVTPEAPGTVSSTEKKAIWKLAGPAGVATSERTTSKLPVPPTGAVESSTVKVRPARAEPGAMPSSASIVRLNANDFREMSIAVGSRGGRCLGKEAGAFGAAPASSVDFSSAQGSLVPRRRRTTL